MQLIQAYTLATVAIVALANSAAIVMAQDYGPKFAESLPKTALSDTCQNAVRNLGYTAPNLGSCYRSSGLYFSTLDTVCSANCLASSVKASQALNSACNLNDPAVKATPAHVYSTWSNQQAAEAVCRKNTRNQYCLQSISSIGPTIANYVMSKTKPELVQKYKLNEIDWTTLLDCKGPCACPLYDSVQGNAEQIPVLYFFDSKATLTDLFKVYEEKCGFKPAQAKAPTSNCTGTHSNNGTASAPAAPSNGAPVTIPAPSPSGDYTQNKQT